MENPSEPISDATYFDCLEGIIERSKVREHLLWSILHSCTTPWYFCCFDAVTRDSVSLGMQCWITFPWDDLCKIFTERSEMAKIPNGIETLPKITIAWVGCTNVTDRRQMTDGWTMIYSEREHVRCKAEISSSIKIFSSVKFCYCREYTCVERRAHFQCELWVADIGGFLAIMPTICRSHVNILTRHQKHLVIIIITQSNGTGWYDL